MYGYIIIAAVFLILIIAFIFRFRYRQRKKCLKAINLLLKSELSSENINNYGNYASASIARKVHQIIDRHKKENLSAKELQVLLVLGSNSNYDLSDCIKSNNNVLNFEHKQYVINKSMIACDSMQHRLLLWLNLVLQGEQDAKFLEMQMPYIEEKYKIVLKNQIRDKPWRLNAQNILDKTNLPELGQVYFMSLINGHDYNLISEYNSASREFFHKRIEMTYLDKKQDLDDFIVRAFNIMLDNLPDWFGVILSITPKTEYTYYYSWYQVTIKHENVLTRAAKINKYYDLLKESEKIKFLVFKLLLDSFADAIIPLLNGQNSSADYAVYHQVLNLLPASVVSEYINLFQHLDPNHKMYAHAWRLFLKEKLENKPGVYQGLNIFIYYYGLWPQFNEGKSEDFSQQDFCQITPLMEKIESGLLSRNKRQEFINQMDLWFVDRNHSIKFPDDSSAGMQELSKLYLGFLKTGGEDEKIRNFKKI